MAFAVDILSNTEDTYESREFFAKAGTVPTAKRDTSRNLEYIAKSAVGAVEDIAKAVALIGGTVIEGRKQQIATELADEGLNVIATEEDKNFLYDYIISPSAVGEMPTVEETNWAVRTISDIGRTILPFIAGGVAGGTTVMTAKTGIDSIGQGIDVETTQQRMVATGAGALVMAGIAPITQKGIQAIYANHADTAVKELAKSLLMNVGTGVASRGIDYQILQDKYPAIAKEIEVVGAKSVGTDIALMAVFGFMGYRQAAKQMHAAGITPKDAMATMARIEEAIEQDVVLHDAVTMQRKRYADIENSPLADSPQPWTDAQAMLERGMKALDDAVPLSESLPLDESLAYKSNPPEAMEIVPIRERAQPPETARELPNVPESLMDDTAKHITGEEMIAKAADLPPELKPDILPKSDEVLVEVKEGTEIVKKPAKEAIEMLDKKAKRFKAFEECMRGSTY